jgi:hypothetical protein
VVSAGAAKRKISRNTSSALASIAGGNLMEFLVSFYLLWSLDRALR